MPNPLLGLAVTLLYLGGAMATLWRLARNWRELLDTNWTAQDQSLAMLIGMLVLTPFAVWLHEWGHAAAMRYYGVADPQIHFFFYWGYVSGDGYFTLTTWQQFVVSLAGPFVTYLLGAVLLFVALVMPMRPAVALALATCATFQLALILVMYPAMSLVWGWGDFVGIYRSGVPGPSLVVGVVHAASLVGFVWLMNRRWMQGFLAYPVARPWRLQWVQRVPPGSPAS